MNQAARLVAIAATITSVVAGGCVERRVIIRTNPPGAAAYVDDNWVGLTPVAISPIYYGNRKIRLVKDGCETLTVIQPLPPPWYELPPLDFFSENVVPGKLRDTRTFDFQLHPQAVVQKEDLLASADRLRRGTQSFGGIVTPGNRINTPSGGPLYAPPPGAPGGPPIGAQPYFQLPPGGAQSAAPERILTPSPGQLPMGPPPGGPIYQPPPATQPFVPSDSGSQPYHPLP